MAIKLAIQPSLVESIYKVDFYADMKVALEKGREAMKTNWTFRYTADMQGEEVEIAYTMDWMKGLWRQQLFLEPPAQSWISVVSFTSILSETFPIQGRILEWGPHELLSKSTIETATGSRNDRLVCHVKAKLLVCMTLARFRRNNELANSLMDTRDDTGDVELRGQDFVIKAHSNVLALRSAPLKAKFDRWNEGRPFVFTLDESVTEEVARSILHYIYTLKIPKIDGFADERPLFTLADQLGLNKLIEDWAAGMELDGEEIEEIMLWPEIELPQMSSLKAHVEPTVQGGPKRAWDGAWTGAPACCEEAEGVRRE